MADVECQQSMSLRSGLVCQEIQRKTRMRDVKTCMGDIIIVLAQGGLEWDSQTQHSKHAYFILINESRSTKNGDKRENEVQKVG